LKTRNFTGVSDNFPDFPVFQNREKEERFEIMTNRFSYVVSLMVVLCAQTYGQAKYNSLKSTTLDSAQIEIPDPNDTIDNIVVTSSDPAGRGKDGEYVDRNVLAKTFYVNVALGMGENEFVLNLFKNKKFVMAFTVDILRVAADSPVKSKASVAIQPGTVFSAPTGYPASKSMTSPAVTDAPTASVTQSGPYPSELVSARVSYQSISAATSPPESDVPPSGRATVPLPLPAQTPKTTNEKARDAEDERIPVNPNLRLIFGFEQAGASSATTTGRPFVDLLLNIPLGQFSVKYKNDERTPVRRYFRNAFWTQFKLTSTPNQNLPNLGGITTNAINGFFGSNQSTQINDLVQAFDIKIGWETSLRPNFGLIAGVGATSPLTSEKTVLAYKIPRLPNGDVQPEFKKIFGPDQDFTGINNIILTSGDRDRFMRNWFVGGRLRYQLIPSRVAEVYPAVFDLTIGQDEILTNKLIGAVLKFDSFVPIPIKGLSFLYFGASFSSRLTRKVNTTTFPFFLEPATNVNIFANDNFIRNFRDINQLNSDRDHFSFRFGVDLMQLLNKKDSATSAASQTTETKKALY